MDASKAAASVNHSLGLRQAALRVMVAVMIKVVVVVVAMTVSMGVVMLMIRLEGRFAAHRLGAAATNRTHHTISAS